MPQVRTALVTFLTGASMALGLSMAAGAEESTVTGSVIGIYRDFGLIVRINSDKDQSFPCHTHIVVAKNFVLPFDENSCEPTAKVSQEHKAQLEEAFGPKSEGHSRKIMIDVPQNISIGKLEPRNCGMLEGTVQIAGTSITLEDYMAKFGYKKSK